MPSNFIAKGGDGYEAIMGRWSRRLAGPFLDFSGVPSRGRVLDAGCGTGSLTLALAARPDLTPIEALDFDFRITRVALNNYGFKKRRFDRLSVSGRK